MPFTNYRETAHPDPAQSYFAFFANLPVVGVDEVLAANVEAGQMGPLIRELWKRPEIRQELLETVKKLYARDHTASEPFPEVSTTEFDLLVALLTYVAMSDNAQEQLARAFTEDVSLPDTESAVDAIRMGSRRRAIKEFEHQLNWKKTGATKWTEPQWETFFRREPWLLGLNLRECEFLTEIQGQPNLQGKDLTGKGGQRGDSLMATEGSAKFTVLVALKTPEAELIQKEAGAKANYRNRAHRVGEHVVGGLAQVQSEAYNFDASSDNYQNKTKLLYDRMVHTVRPLGIVVVGNLDQIEGHEDKLASFQHFRACLHGVRIVTYDELLERAKALVDGERTTSNLTPRVP